MGGCKEAEDRYVGGWMAAWTGRDSSILQLELGEQKINPDTMGRENTLAGLQSHRSRMC